MTESNVFFPRSFRLLDEMLRGVDFNPVIMQEWAERLQPYQMEGPVDKMRLSRMFFESYKDRLAGICGCSYLLPDHQRVKVAPPFEEQFVITLGLMFHAGVFGDKVPANAVARALKMYCDISYKENTLSDKLRQYSHKNGYSAKW